VLIVNDAELGTAVAIVDVDDDTFGSEDPCVVDDVDEEAFTAVTSGIAPLPVFVLVLVLVLVFVGSTVTVLITCEGSQSIREH
jgi:hypothetical protein